MLKTAVQQIRQTTIVRCQGPIVVGEDLVSLRDAVVGHSSASRVVLDLAGVRRIDAGGIGVLLGLREWAETNMIRFKLMNARPKVDRVLKLTKLDRVFEFCTVSEMLCLTYLAELIAVDSRSTSSGAMHSMTAAGIGGDKLVRAS